MQESGEQSVDDAVPREQAPSLGARLRSAREAKDLALEKIADELRIEAHVLRALEEDRLEDIPIAPVFVKGYIKQYGRQLGLNYNELREAYVAQIGSDEVDLLPSQAIQLRDERQITIWIIAALVLLLLGVFLFVWWLGDDRLDLRGATAPVTRPIVESPPPAAARRPAVDEATDAATGRPAAAGDGAEPASPAAADRAAGRPAPADPSLQPREPSASSPSPAAREPSVSTPSPAPREPSAASPSPALGGAPEPGAAAITVNFRAESWAEITGSDGGRIFYDLGPAGTELRFFATPPVDVLLGNADAVDITVDDESFTIPRRGRRGNIVSFVIPPATD